VKMAMQQRCKAAACKQTHAKHTCSMCGDQDSDHISQFCYVFCTPAKVAGDWKCKAIGCRRAGCTAHICSSCHDKDANHVAENCPKGTPQRTCLVPSCRSPHKSHGCVVCGNRNSNHRSYECPDPGNGTIITAYHQTQEKAAACIMASRQMKKGTAGVCGPGIYFATSPAMTRGKAHNFGFMIECRIFLGKRLIVDRQDLSLNGDKVKGMGYDSVHCVRDKKNPKKDEYIIYDWNRASIVSMYPCDPFGKLRPQLLIAPSPVPAPTPGANPTPVPATPAAGAPVIDPTTGCVQFKSCIQSPAFLEAAQWVYDHHLKNKYADGPNHCDWKGQTVYRPNHGLAHTIRCASYAPLICSLARLQVSQNEVEKIQIAMLFYVAGRESEASWAVDPVTYEKYRVASSQIYLTYAQGKGWRDCNRFVRGLKSPHSKQYDPARIAFAACHELDMLRCKPQAEYDQLMNEKVATLFGTKKKPLDKTIIDKFKALATASCQATGDKVYKSKRNYHKFFPCSQDPKACVDALAALPSL